MRRVEVREREKCRFKEKGNSTVMGNLEKPTYGGYNGVEHEQRVREPVFTVLGCVGDTVLIKAHAS